MQPTGSFAPTINPSLTQYHQHAAAAEQQPDFGAQSTTSRAPLDVAPQNPPKKAKNRRKRHVPPGPAGVWFQGATAAANVAAPQNRGDEQNNNNNDDEEEIIALDDDDNGSSSSNNNSNTPSRRRRRKKRPKPSDTTSAAASDVSRCLAWTAMQQTLNLCTPYLPPYLSIMERYKQLRSYYNADKRYVLLPEIISSGGSNFASLHSRSLLVLVHAVQCHSYTDWTVELQDECGASIQAWLEPKFVQEEQSERQQGKSGSVQMGHCWLVEGASLFVSTNPSSTTSSNNTEWWLLIQKENVKQLWTTHSSRDWSDQQHLTWMERRRTMSSNHEVDLQSTQPEADEENSNNASIGSYRIAQTGSQQFGAPTGFGAISPSERGVPRMEQRPHRRLETSAVVSASTTVKVAVAIPPVTAVKVAVPPPPVTAPSRPVNRQIAQVTTSSRPNPYGKGPARSAPEPGSTVHPQAVTIDTPRVQEPKTIDFSQFVAPPPTQEETTPAIARTRPAAPISTTASYNLRRTTNESTHTLQSDHTTRGLVPTQGAGTATAKTPTPPKAPTVRESVSTASKSPAENPLSQFCAVSAKKSSPKPGQSSASLSRSQSADRASPKLTSAKKKPRKRSPKATTDLKKSASPKLASSLWTNMDESMLGMLDGDDEEQSSQMRSDRQATVAASKDNEQLAEKAPKPTEEYQQPSLLFQASAFDGVDLDDLFDED
jgi:hypothetical protein